MIVHAQQTSVLLAAIAESSESSQFTLDELLAVFRQRAFGVLLLLCVLPALLPIPVGVGAFVGVLVGALGMQLMCRLRKPWMPQRLRQRPFARETLRRFLVRMAPWLRRLERLSRPRIEPLFATVTGNFITGLLLLAMGVMISLPIPLTNYPFGLLILAYAFALIERDGALLLIVWAISLVVIASFAGVVVEALVWLRQWLS